MADLRSLTKEELISLLSALCHLKVSVGEVVGMLASVSALGQSAYDGWVYGE